MSTRLILSATIVGALRLCGGDANAACVGRDLLPTLQKQEPQAFAAFESRADSFAFRHGRLFALTREGVAPSYLFGTLHIADPRLTMLPGVVREKVETAATVVVESTEVIWPMKPSPAQNAKLRKAILATDDERPERLLNAHDFASLQALAVERGLPADAARLYKPAVLALVLDQPACAAGVNEKDSYLDALIAHAAAGAGVRVVGLETLAEQFESLQGLSSETQTALLKALIGNVERGPDIIETQIAFYRRDDPGALLSWMMSSEPSDQGGAASAAPEFLQKLVSERSERMLERLRPILDRGNAFVAVGAAHIPGPRGLAILLQNAGYVVTPVE